MKSSHFRCKLMFFHTIIILMSGSTSKGEWKEPWHNGNMHNIEDFLAPTMPLKQPPFILSLRSEAAARLADQYSSSLTYSYIRPSTYNWNIKSSCHSLSPLCLAIGLLPASLLDCPSARQPHSRPLWRCRRRRTPPPPSSSFHLKASFVY